MVVLGWGPQEGRRIHSVGTSRVIPPRSPHGPRASGSAHARGLRSPGCPHGRASGAPASPHARGRRSPPRCPQAGIPAPPDPGGGSPPPQPGAPTHGTPTRGAESGAPAHALPWCPAAGAGGPCPPSRHAARPGSSRSSRGRIPSLRCEPAAARPARVRSRRPRLAPSLRPAPLPGRPCRLGQGNEPQSPGVSAERHRQQAALPPAGLE